MSETLGYCICGHGRADHASDDIDVAGELGKCLNENCHCEIFTGSKTESRFQLHQAAPELLEALEAALSEFDSVARNTTRGHRYGEAVIVSTQTREQVRAAIRKAKGEL